jgi:hypothetical protein
MAAGCSLVFMAGKRWRWRTRSSSHTWCLLGVPLADRRVAAHKLQDLPILQLVLRPEGHCGGCACYGGCARCPR